MHFIGKTSIVKIAVAMTLLLLACKESPPPKSASNENTEDANPSPPSPPYQPSPTSPSPSTDPCKSTDKGTDTDTDSEIEDETGEDPFALTGISTTRLKKARRSKTVTTSVKATGGFGLTATVTYDSDIKSLLSSNCTSCHKPGGDKPDLSTYSAAKSGLAASISEIDSDKMPKSSPLSSSDKAKFKAWQSAGAPESSSDTDSDSDSDTNSDTESSSDDCDSGKSTDDDVGDGFADLVNPPELEECKDKDKVYDRKAGECHKADIADFSCDKAGIIAAFKKVGINAESKLSDILSDGYEIDQCGMYEKEPIVYFTKAGESTSDSVSLKIKKLCKPTASVCK